MSAEYSSTLVAERTDTGARLTVGDLPVDDLRLLSDVGLLRCPACGTPLILKAGPVRVHHFAHVSAADCAAADHEPETDAHRAGKLALYRHFREQAAIARVEQTIATTGQRADTYFTLADGVQYAVEFQQANNSAARWDERHALYRGAGIYDIWFLGQVRYAESTTEPPRPISPYDPRPVIREGYEAGAGAFRVREMERAMLLATAKRPAALYYLDPDLELVTVLLARELRHYTLRAYRYRLPLSACVLRDGDLWTPVG